VSRRLVTVLPSVAFALAVLAAPARADAPVTLVDILAGFSAKESCSCAFVVGQTDAYCQEFGKTGGFDVEVRIDRAARAVESRFAGVSRTARVDGDGCKLDGPK